MSEVRTLILRLEESMRTTFDRLEAIPEEYMDQPCRHGCARGGTVWHLLTHNIDHERMHTGQVIGVRDVLRRLQQDRRSRLLAELYVARAMLAASLIGLDDADLDRKPAEHEWSIREAVEHVLYWDRNSIDDLHDQYLSERPRAHDDAGA
jgi:hypothetical protein